jgi:hypothetical protein
LFTALFSFDPVGLVSGSIGWVLALGSGGCGVRWRRGSGVVWPQDGGILVLALCRSSRACFYAVGANRHPRVCEGESVLVMTLAYFASMAFTVWWVLPR